MKARRKISKETTTLRCFNVITNEKDPKFGQVCWARLLHRNERGEVAGNVTCQRCGALYEIVDNLLILEEYHYVNRTRG